MYIDICPLLCHGDFMSRFYLNTSVNPIIMYLHNLPASCAKYEMYPRIWEIYLKGIYVYTYFNITIYQDESTKIYPEYHD